MPLVVIQSSLINHGMCCMRDSGLSLVEIIVLLKVPTVIQWRIYIFVAPTYLQFNFIQGFLESHAQRTAGSRRQPFLITLCAR